MSNAFAKPGRAQAMILAAGMGTRMMPITAETPKALLDVANRSILHRIIDHLETHGVDRSVVNIHHHAEKMEQALKPYVEAGSVIISDEREGLFETGGSVKRAIPMLDPTDFFVINADVVWQDGKEPMLQRLRRFWHSETMDVLLLMIPTSVAYGYDGVGDFFMDFSDASEEEAASIAPLRFRDDAEYAPYMYGAVQIVKSSMYEDMPAGSWSNREIFRKAAAQGRLFGLVHDAGWVHVGTPSALFAATDYIDAGWVWPDTSEHS